MEALAAAFLVVRLHPGGGVQIEDRHRRSRTRILEAGVPEPRIGRTGGSPPSGSTGDGATGLAAGPREGAFFMERIVEETPKMGPNDKPRKPSWRTAKPGFTFWEENS